MTRIPTQKECLRILKDNHVKDNIIAHLKAVCDFSMKIVDLLENKDIKVNRGLVAAASLLHDVKKLEQGHHEIEGAKYIESLGYIEVANVIRKHGLAHLESEEFVPKTWEEKIVFYSDKRLRGNRMVSVDERFDDIKQRYKKEDVEHELEFTKKIEKELLGNEKL